jgi:signal peptidase I
VLIKNFGYDVVRVNNKDMLATFEFGDPVLVKKSFNSFTTNDLVYFKFPVADSININTNGIQRIFGLPGDSLEIKEQKVYINGVQIEDTLTIKQNYYIKSVQALDSNFKKEFNLVEGGAISQTFDYSYSLTKYEADQLRQHPYIVNVDLKMEKAKAYDEACFPSSPLFAWNNDHYGKIYIPKKDDTLRLDTINIKLYAQVIAQHEKNELVVKNDSIIINGQPTSVYVVKKNYYFVLGDNRGNANDSRNWGYLPQNMIMGKVLRNLSRR